MKLKILMAILAPFVLGGTVLGVMTLVRNETPANSPRLRGEGTTSSHHADPGQRESGEKGSSPAPQKGGTAGSNKSSPQATGPVQPGQPPAHEASVEAPPVPGRKYKMATEGDPNSYLLEASDQQSDGRSMVIRKVIIRGSGGYIALHSQQGEPWPLFAASAFLPEGEHNNVVIRWGRSVAVDTTLYPMLHVEDNGNTTFDFPDHDEAPKINGAYIVFPVKLYVG